jgi:hypothetical protein
MRCLPDRDALRKWVTKPNRINGSLRERQIYGMRGVKRWWSRRGIQWPLAELGREMPILGKLMWAE